MAELIGAELDVAVALALGYVHEGAIGVNERNDATPYCLQGCNDWWKSPEGDLICAGCSSFPPGYCTDWSQGGPIIERERIDIDPSPYDEPGKPYWLAFSEGFLSFGPTPLIAAMRAFVASET